MKKEAHKWSIRQVAERFNRIIFPEYQREPTVWNRRAKQRLIDSIIRDFDIASLYLYRTEDGDLECIDGRQRINAIMSFRGENPESEDNGFTFDRINEIVPEEESPYDSLRGLSWEEIRDQDDRTSREFVEKFEAYEVVVIELSDSARPEEFNLQFSRLNLGVIINSGEKLNAMVGFMRDVCFAGDGIGAHPFLEGIRIPTRRFAREQTAAQILCQIFALESDGGFARARYIDLQFFFKRHSNENEDDKAVVDKVRACLDRLSEGFQDLQILRNRAITVSVVCFCYLKELDAQGVLRFYEFLQVFIGRLQWQLSKGLNVDSEYHYLIEFQRHLTQASVEKPALRERHRVLGEEWARWLDEGRLRGDQDFQVRTDTQPRVGAEN